MYRVFSDWQNKCYLILVVLFPYCKKEYSLLNMLMAFPARPSYPEPTCFSWCQTPQDFALLFGKRQMNVFCFFFYVFHGRKEVIV